jgi:hypothetical protein
MLEDLLDDALARTVGGMRLAREDHLDRSVRVPQQPREAVHVGEQQTGSLVGREPSGEADREHARIEDRLDLGKDGGRFAVTGKLGAQPTLDEDRELALLAEMRLPQLIGRDPREALPEAVLPGARVERVEVGIEMPGEELDDRLADPGRAVDPVRDRDDPAVRDALPGRIGGGGVELADGVPKCLATLSLILFL